ncbi:MAG: hypothetical protein Kow0013_23460 [Pararhodobacter sp.]
MPHMPDPARRFASPGGVAAPATGGGDLIFPFAPEEMPLGHQKPRQPAQDRGQAGDDIGRAVAAQGHGKGALRQRLDRRLIAGMRGPQRETARVHGAPPAKGESGSRRG